MDVLAASDLVILLSLFCVAGLMLLGAVVLMVVWVWMLNDWNKRQKPTSPLMNGTKHR